MPERPRTPRIIRTPLASIAVAAVLLAGACGGGLDGALPSISVPPATGPTVSVGASPVSGDTGVTISPSGPLPTSSPGITGSVAQGQATVSASGGVNTTVTFGELSTPAVWSPPPGAIALSWAGPGGQTLSLGGPSFTSQIATDGSHSLAFTLNVGDAPLEFRSSAGECTVTISPALPTQVGGSFLCTNLASTDDTVTVNAQGSFSATG
ncbi:MAG: hypothetical protein ABI572_08720 [Actinomycetota bacterium]